MLFWNQKIIHFNTRRMKVVNGLYNMRKAKRSNWNSLLLTLKIVKAASKQNFWSNQKQAMKPIIHLLFENYSVLWTYYWLILLSSDWIEIRDGPDSNAPLVGGKGKDVWPHSDKICGYDLPGPIISTSNSLFVRFVTYPIGYHDRRTGFRAIATKSKYILLLTSY